MIPLWLWAGCVFVLGSCIGSFLNVVIWRLPRNQSLSSPARSYCPRCQKQIAWHDNIPILAWLFLGGKCRKCGQPISIRYPLVELATGLLFLGLLLVLRGKILPLVLPVIFTAYLLYGFIRPRLPRRVRDEIESEPDNTSAEEHAEP